MLVGPSSRSRARQKQYAHHTKTKIRNNACDFCEFTKSSEQVIGSSRHFWIVTNIFGYDVWDDTPVVDHLMIVPKRHVIGLEEFTSAEIEQYFKIVCNYEKQGYSLYARAPQNIAKSVLHQHSHLIKLGTKRNAFKLYIRKPHLMVYK